MPLKMLHDLRRDNDIFMQKHKEGYFQNFKDSQHPRTTVVACSDSRFHAHAINETPDNDIFMVRVIGNQIHNAAGSIEFGIRQLHTPLLLIIGHTGCGAVAAATRGYYQFHDKIQKDLMGLHLPVQKENPTEEELHANVEANIHHQIEIALTQYKDLVDKQKLMVVGAVYDFRNEYKQGAGKLIFLNINGAHDLQTIHKFEETIKPHNF